MYECVCVCGGGGGRRGRVYSDGGSGGGEREGGGTGRGTYLRLLGFLQCFISLVSAGRHYSFRYPMIFENCLLPPTDIRTRQCAFVLLLYLFFSPTSSHEMCYTRFGCSSQLPLLLGGLGGVVKSFDFCLASLKSLGCFYFLHSDNGRR